MDTEWKTKPLQKAAVLIREPSPPSRVTPNVIHYNNTPDERHLGPGRVSGRFD
jgi:hypothetical protein